MGARDAFNRYLSQSGAHEQFDAGAAELNVMHTAFGARGDGNADDTVAIQKALRAAGGSEGTPAMTGGIVRLPAQSTFPISSPLTNSSSSVYIRGGGTSSKILPSGYNTTTGESTSAFVFTNCDEVVFEDLLIHGGSMTAPRLASLYGSTATSTQLKTIYVYPGHSLLAGDDIYIGDPTFTAGITGSPPIYADAWELNQVASVGTADSRGAIKITLTNNMVPGRTYTDRTRIAQKINGYGGHGISLTGVTRAVFRNVHFKNVLTSCIDVNQVSELIVDGCTFDGYTSAQADSCYFAARGFGVGGWDVSRLRFTNNMVKNVPGRRTAGVEIRATETSHNATEQASILDCLIRGNTFDSIGSLTDLYNSHGSCVNIVTGRVGSTAAYADVRRVVIEGNTSYGVGDGHYWIATPDGEVVAANNVCEFSMSGPFININAPCASITGNVMKTGGLSAIECDATGAGSYGSGSPGYLNLRGIVIVGNSISDMIHAQSGHGIVVTTATSVPPAANAPRQVIIANNYVNGCWQDGIHITNPKGDFVISGNVILDCNQGQLAATTLVGASVSAPNGYQQLTVASTAGFVPVQFVQIGSTAINTTLNGSVSAGATSFVVTDATGIATGHALWLGVAEANTAEIVVPTNVVGTTVSCAALALAHSNGVAITATYRPLIVSIDSATQMTVQYNQGIWANGTAVTSPFPGSAGIAITGSATYPAANFTIQGNRVGIDTVAGSTQYGVLIGSGVPGPMNISGNDFTGCVVGSIRPSPQLLLYQNNPVMGYGGSGVHVATATFVETDNGDSDPHVYTATINLPAESTLLDIKVRTTTLWTAATTALMDVGDELDPDGWFTQINLKGTDLLVGEEINFVQTGGKEGAYLVLSSGLRLRAYANVAKAISGIVTTNGTTGHAGRSRMMVVYATTVPFAATKDAPLGVPLGLMGDVGLMALEGT